MYIIDFILKTVFSIFCLLIGTAQTSKILNTSNYFLLRVLNLSKSIWKLRKIKISEKDNEHFPPVDMVYKKTVEGAHQDEIKKHQKMKWRR